MKKLKKILLVEDEPVTALLLTQQLKNKNYNVAHLSSGEEAIENFFNNQNCCDIILMDIDLGFGIDGIETAKTILSKIDVPIVFISSHTSPEIVEKTEQVTSYGYILKNSNITIIDASIKMAIKLFEAKKEIEENKNKLKESEEKYRRITENISDVVWTTDLELNLTFISSSIEKIVGITPEEYMKLGFEKRYSAQSIELIYSMYKEELVKERNPKYPKDRTKTVELQQYHANGNLIWVSINVSFIRDENKVPIGVQGITRDISKQKEAEFQLKESFQRNSALLDAIPDIMFVFDKTGKFIDYHAPEFCNLLIDPAHFIGMHGKDVLPDYLAKINQENIDRLFESKLPQTYSYHLEIDGITSYYDARMVLYGKDKALSIVRDISDKKRDELALKESERRISSILANMPGMSYRCINDLNWTMEFVSEGCFDLSGYKPEELIGNNAISFNEVICPDFRDHLWKKWQRVLSKKTKFTEEYIIITKDGTTKWVWEQGNGVFADNGDVIALEGFIIDITDRKKAEKRLEHSHYLMKYIIEHNRSAIAVHDNNMNYIYVSQKYLDDYKIDDKSIIGKHHYDVFPDLPEKWRKVHKRALKGEVLSSEEDPYIRQDGSIEWTRWECRPWHNSDKSIGGIIVNTEVITDRKKAELELKEKNTFIQTILDNLPIGVALNEINEGKATYMNNKFQEIYGWDKEIMTDIPTFFQKVFPDEKYRETIVNIIMSDINSGITERMQWEGLKVTNSDGTEKIVNAANIPLPQQNTMVSTVVDVTAQKTAEKSLRISEERFQLSMEATNDGLWDWNVKTDVSYFSPAYYKMLGYEVGVFTPQGSTWKNLLHPEDLVKAKQTNIDCVNGKTENFEIEFRMKTAAGNWKWILSRGMCVDRDKKGIANRIVGTHVDITERKIAEQTISDNEKKYRLIFEKSPLGIFHFNKDGVITDCNDNFIIINGINKKDAIIGMNMLKLPDADIVKATKDLLQGKTTSFEGTYTFITSNKTIPIRLLFAPMFGNEGNIEGGIGLLEDRSSIIQKENLEKQVAIAKEAVIFKQKFLANMSHEIRTPLTGMLGFTEMLAKTKLTKKQHSYLNIVRNAGDNLREIINLILDYSKIESGQVKLKFSALETKNIFETSISLFSSICHKDVVLETVISPKLPKYIKTDLSRLNQIINNLLSNAVKFTDKGKITLKANLVNAIDKDNVLIKIEIIDTGIGIPFNSQKDLFKPFSQVEDNEIRKIEGTGLGLSICRELSQILGGEIGVESQAGAGSNFWFTFSAGKAKKSEIIESNKKVIDKNKESSLLKILLVDDKKINQMVVTIMLNSLGHNVDCASNGKEAIDKFKPDTYDLVLMDIQMPEMDGITATRKLKEKFKKLPPIVGLSANAFEGDREKYMSMGMDDYLTKPVKSEDINALFDRLF